jgi:hypothetical protein
MLATLDSCGCANLDLRYAATQLCQPVLQFLTIVTTRRDLDLRFDLVDSSVDLLRVTTTFDDRRVVFRRDDASCTAEV